MVGRSDIGTAVDVKVAGSAVRPSSNFV